MFDMWVELDSSINMGFYLCSKADFLLEKEDPRKIGYSQEFVHSIAGWNWKVNYPLVDVDSNKFDSFLGFDHSRVIFLVTEKHSNVDFPLVGVVSWKIGDLWYTYYSSLT